MVGSLALQTSQIAEQKATDPMVALEPDPLDDRALGDDRDQPRGAKLGGLFEQQVEAVFLQQRGAQEEIGHLLAHTKPFDHLELMARVRAVPSVSE